VQTKEHLNDSAKIFQPSSNVGKIMIQIQYHLLKAIFVRCDAKC